MLKRSLLTASTALLALSCLSDSDERYANTFVRETSSPATDDDAILPFEATEVRLDNGLVVIVVPTGMPNLVSLQIPVLTGSRNEVEDGKTGFAHFFEHMMFRGTEQYPPHEYEAIITRAGARQNAYTTDDYTNYHVTFAKEDLEKILEIEADRFQNLAYTEEQFRTEALAVLGEYNKNSSNPYRKLFEVMRDKAYTRHTYKHTTMGFIEDIEAMPDQLEYAKVFFDRWYRPEHTAVCVVGDVDPDEVVALVKKYWGSWERGSYTADIPEEPAPRGPVYTHVPWELETSPYLAVAFHGPAFSTTRTDSAALDLLFELYFGNTSELYNRLVVGERKVDQLFSYAPDSQDPSLKYILARVTDPGDVTYVRDAILATMNEARREAVSEKRLEEAKSNLRYSAAAGFDSTDAIAGALAAYVRYTREFDTLNAAYRMYASLTTQDLLETARRYIADERLVVATLSHGELDASVRDLPALASFGMSGDATAGSDLAMLVNASPSKQLSIKLLFESGSADDPPGKEGLAALSAALISGGGSSEMSYEDIQKALFPISGGFGSQVDRELTVFNGVIHADNFRTWSDVALRQLTSPGFSPEDFERVKTNLRNALIQDLRSNDDEELGKEVLQQVVFRDTAYGHPTMGSVAGIDSITVEDVKDFVKTHYTRDNLVIGFAGDLDPEVESRLRRELNLLPAGMPAQPEAPKGREASGIEVTLVEKDARATAISFGFPIEVTRSHPDYPALYLARTWLGEHRSSMSHLYQRIREVRGMNYGDYAYIEAFPYGGRSFFPPTNVARRAQLFEVWIRPVPTGQGHHALRIAMHELEKLVQNGLTEEQFESTREYLSKNVFLLTATQSDQLGYALDSRFYGIDDYPTYMREALDELSVEEVNAAIRRHLQVEDVHVAMILKDAQGMKERLVADTHSSIQYASEKPAELLAEDREIGARKLNVRPENVTIVPVAEVFAK